MAVPGLVSVIVTSYNVAPFLRLAVDSVLQQSYTEMEILVLDDGSTDHSLETIENIADPRLHRHLLDHRGPVETLNHGIELAQGEYIAFLDGDDLYAPGNLHRQVEVLRQNPEVDLTFCQSRLIDEDGSDLGPTTRSVPGPLGFDDLLADNLVGNGSAVVVRAEAIRRAGFLDTHYGACYDLDLWLRIARLRPGNVRSIAEVLVYYRRRRGQLTKSRELMESNWKRLLGNMKSLEPEAVSKLESRASSNMYRFFAFTCYEQGALGEAFHLMSRAIGFDPLYALTRSRTYLMLLGIAARALLPARAHEMLERRFRRGPEWQASR